MSERSKKIARPSKRTNPESRPASAIRNASAFDWAKVLLSPTTKSIVDLVSLQLARKGAPASLQQSRVASFEHDELRTQAPPPPEPLIVDAEIIEPETIPDFRRASGESFCQTCGHLYRNHPYSEHIGYSGPFLRRLCDGSLVKL